MRKFKRSIPSVVLLLSLSFFISCASTPTSKKDLLKELSENSEKRTAVSGTVFLTSALSGKSETAPGVLLVQWPDKLRLEVQDPVGSVLALLVVSGSKFWLYRSTHPQVLTGSIENLPSDLKLPFASEDLVRIFLARPDWEEWKAATKEEEQFILKIPGGEERLRWDRRASEVVEWSQKKSGHPLSKVQYEDYAAKDGALYPEKIRLSRTLDSGKEESILLVWREMETGVPSEKKLFQIEQQPSFGRKIKILP